MILKFDETPTIYVDVDGTLLFWPNNPGRPPRPDESGYGDTPKVNWPLVDALKEWHRPGRCLVIWSRGGANHCRNAAKLCGLSPDACLPKPRIAVDDKPRTVCAGDAERGFVVVDPHTSKDLLEKIFLAF